MIEVMRKYSFFIFEPEYQTFLQHLKRLGVVHIKNNTNPETIERIRAIKDELAFIDKFISKMGGLRSSYKLSKNQSAEDLFSDGLAEDVLTDYDTFVKEFHRLEEQSKSLQKELSQIKHQVEELSLWGDFDHTLISKLSQSGYYIHFWSVQKTSYQEEWETAYNAQEIQVKGRNTYFITLGDDPNGPELPECEQISLPQTSLSALEIEANRLKEEIDRLRSKQAYLAYHSTILEETKITLQNKYKLDNAYYQGTRLYDKLVILEGWVPEKLASQMEQEIDHLGYAYTELAFSATEDVPIKLRNNRFTRAFQPIVELFSLPNYNELDPTSFIAPFFLLFFGICFGDAGYGVLLLLLSIFLKFKVKKKSLKGLFELLQWLGGSGVIIGFLSGSFFGIELVKLPLFQNIKSYFLSSDNMMVISLVLGLVHILFAKYVSAFKKTKQFGISASLSTFAWPTLIISLILCLGLPQLKIVLPLWITCTLWAIVGGCVLLALLWNSPGKGIFFNLGAGLWNTYGVVSGLLGDTLSYIRLFAIGLTGAILGQVFNRLAMTVTTGMSIYVAIPLGLFILLLGHTINFALSMISSFVHPVRLIFVEYFNNSEYEGGGKPYEPLKELNLKDDE